ncbi:hypothetical protein VaNZ11_011902 [Volvox africanus]|uniref:CRM domain-containing protein n=1 Tax=Volvox africanus TaxID=51714 RepID=A0ABQ5SCJ9_9CHLO|nr:hypothetical protein VaNZ11_011902 [Volvox africanus]
MPVRARWLYAPGRTWNIGADVLDGSKPEFIADFICTIRHAADVLNGSLESDRDRGWSQPSTSCFGYRLRNVDPDMLRLGCPQRPWTLSCSCTACARPAAANHHTAPHVSRPSSSAALESFPSFDRGGLLPVQPIFFPFPPAKTLRLGPLATPHIRNPERHQAIGEFKFPKHLRGIYLTLSGPTTTPNGNFAHSVVHGLSTSARGVQGPAWDSPGPAPVSAPALSEEETWRQTEAHPANDDATLAYVQVQVAAGGMQLPYSPHLDGDGGEGGPGGDGGDGSPAAGSPLKQELLRLSHLPTSLQAGAEAAGAPERIPILPPRQRHQSPLSRDVSKYLWRNSEELAAAGRLLRVQVGKAGVTRALMARMGHLLEHHQLIRVNLLQNCPMDVKFVAWLAENALDCVCIKVKGRTATLFRQKGLPRPPASFPTDPMEHHQYPATAAVRCASSERLPDDARGVTSNPALALQPLPLAPAHLGSGVPGPGLVTGVEAASAREVTSSQPPRVQGLPKMVVGGAQSVGASQEEESEYGNTALPRAHTGAPNGRRPVADVVKQQQGQGQEQEQGRGWTTVTLAAVDGDEVAEADAVVGRYRAALGARFRQWWAIRDTRRLRLGVRRP